jgi:hypothetical protein
MDQLSQKACKTCGETKPLSEYYTNAQMADGHGSSCKLCVRKRNGAHYRKTHPLPERSTTYYAIHLYLIAHFPKTGVCEECGKQAKTQHALIRGREYSRSREDYRELCQPCHGLYDHGGDRSYAAKLTRAQAAEIKRRYKPGAGRDDPDSRDSLAAEFGVHRNSIWNIGTGRTWVELAEQDATHQPI